MSMKDILSLVNTELIALGALPNGSPLRLGDSKGLKSSPPLVWWIPTSGEGGPPNVSMTSTEQAAWYSANPGKQIPRALGVRQIQIECHCWAGGSASTDDFSSTETLMNQVISSVHHQIGPGNYRFIGEQWITPGSEAHILGHKVIVRLMLRVPLFEVQVANPVVTEQVVLLHATQTIQEGQPPPATPIISEGQQAF